MSSLANLKKGAIPNDVLQKYLILYRMIGSSEKHLDYLNERHKHYYQLTVVEDTFNIYKMFFKDAKITDSRLNNILEKKVYGEPKNKEEIIARNIRYVFDKMENSREFFLERSELVDLHNIIYKDVVLPGNSFKKESNGINYSEELSSLMDGYNNIIKDNSIEYIYLATSFLVDFLKLSPFKEGNEIIGLIAFYCLILNSDIKSFKYTSFFKKIFLKEKDYIDSVNQGFYLYNEGFNDCFRLLKFILDQMIESYKDIKEIYSNVSFDKQLKKNDIVENVIYKLDEKFSKEDLRKILPDVSDSTLNRVLKEMQEEGKISSFGRGRSATWIRLDHSRDEKFEDLE